MNTHQLSKDEHTEMDRLTRMKTKAVLKGLYPIADHEHLNTDFIHHGKDADCITNFGTVPLTLTLKIPHFINTVYLLIPHM